MTIAFVETPAPWAREMKVLSDPACKQCGGGVEMVADIAPRDREPGLRAFVCSECGTVESVLIPGETK